MGDGKYVDSLALFGGLSIWDANPKIVEALKEAGALMHVEKHKHSYMPVSYTHLDVYKRQQPWAMMGP